ncbi:MAG TPA: hypothetical protein VF812_08290 [Ktedonobacterales bacterium]
MRSSFRRGWRTRLFTALALVAAAFFAFQIVVRLLTPDAVRYQSRLSNNGQPAITKTGTITDAATVARWRALVTARPSGKLIFAALMGQWQGTDTCAPLSVYQASYVFLWHGVPIEVVSTLQSCDSSYMVSRGGIPDPRTYLIEPLT